MDESIAAVRGLFSYGPVRRFVRLAIGVGLISVVSTSALAAEPGDSVQEVTITGSRIRLQTGMNTPVPVTTVAPSDLAALNPGASIGAQLDRLPRLMQTESAQRSSGALFGNAGGTYLNLRGLESKRTLVLFDGSR